MVMNDMNIGNRLLLALKDIFRLHVDVGDFCFSILTCIAFLLIAYGVYQVAMDFVDAPSRRARRAVQSLKRTKRSAIDAITIPVANFLTPHIRLSYERRNTLQRKLYSAGVFYSPEFFTAKALSEALFMVALAIPAYFIFPFLSVVFLVLAVSVYFKNGQEIDDIVKKKTEKIDGELVLFASTIKQQLTTSRDVMKILQTYRKVCGDEFMRELDITIADMKTGNYENALRNLEMRVPSIGLSEIIRGLLAVMRGDNQQSYFEMLEHDLTVKGKEELKRIAIKRPEKLKPVTVVLVLSFLAMYVYVLITVISEQLSQMF